MRLLHLVFAIAGVALVLAIARDPVGRVALIVFTTALGLVITGLSAVMMLFRTIGSIGMARTFGHYAESVFATAGVLAFGTASMLIVLWCGAWLLMMAVP